jgi:hypothetical protein
MPWSVALKVGTGESFREGWVEGDAAVIHFELLPRDAVQFPILSSIDHYDGAFFVGTQLDPFLSEWRKMRDRVAFEEDREEWDLVERLALRARKDGLQLVFVGD